MNWGMTGSCCKSLQQRFGGLLRGAAAQGPPQCQLQGGPQKLALWVLGGALSLQVLGFRGVSRLWALELAACG